MGASEQGNEVQLEKVGYFLDAARRRARASRPQPTNCLGARRSRAPGSTQTATTTRGKTTWGKAAWCRAPTRRC